MRRLGLFEGCGGTPPPHYHACIRTRPTGLAGRICILWYWQATQLGRDEITLPIRRFVALRTDSAALRSDCSAARHEPTSS